MTVADIRKAIDGLPDDMIVRPVVRYDWQGQAINIETSDDNLYIQNFQGKRLEVLLMLTVHDPGKGDL